MAEEIKLPRFGKTMEQGTVVNCLVKVGQKIKKGDIIFEIETDKATLEMESPAEGFVKVISAQQGQTLQVDQVLLILGQENEQVNINTAAGQNKQKTSPASVKKSVTTDVMPAGKGENIYKLGQKVPLSKFGKITAEKMLQSKREIPCFYLNVVVDATELVAFREKLNKSVSFNDLIIKALAVGMKQWPIMTGRLEGDSVVLADSIGIGLAVAVKDGLITPVVKDVDKKSLEQIAQSSVALIERAEAGKLTPEDFQDGCITVSNLGPLGVDSFIPIVIPGQCSILGVGKITDTCLADDDKIAVGKLMKLSLAVDHRIANGAEAAQFLDYVAKLLGEPQKLA